MKIRVLELLKEPKNIQKDDLQVLKDQIQEFPYLQTVRALHLYGVHLYDSENYQKELSKTAAYTTDKKNLYHLINGTIETKQIKINLPKATPAIEDKKPFPAYVPKNGGFPLRRPEEKPETEAQTEESPYTAIQPLPELSNQTVEVEGQRNRILFEGEENFLNEENKVKIDLESSMESGNLVTEKLSPAPEVQMDTAEVKPEINELVAEIEDFTSQKANAESDEVSVSEEIEIPSEESENEENFLPEAEVDAVEEVPINFNESEIRVSPESNLEEAVEAVVEDQAISFQEIAPFETEMQLETKDLETEEVLHQNEDQNQTDFTSETIISEDKIEFENEKQKVEDDSQLSFHGTESFLPEVKIESHTPVQKENVVQNSPAKNKYEEEMRRLIEQVEQKMKEAKKAAPSNEKIPDNEEKKGVDSEISFAETQSFEMGTPKTDANEKQETVPVPKEILDEKENSDEAQKVENEEESLPSSGWKPMSFEANALDSAIGKKQVIAEDKSDKNQEPAVEERKAETSEVEKPVAEEVKTEEQTSVEVKESSEVESEEKEEPTEAFNVSFFGNSISSFIKSNQQSEPEVQPEAILTPKIKPDQREIPSILDSNVPGFINTWQSWLKIDRTEEIQKEKIEIKEKAIETFLENNPKISQLKEEVSFVVKEKNDDISHLMTETLARLYTEQKLYSKAIQAYQILIGKHPDRKSYFEEKIQEVKDIRGR
ncbi:hypothetical protein ASG31_02160 [Chryseobacterium sp. Leaf404]|uniref:hypothetical protein n=1 Tax=unclassified Chryseobacterium TaxID=2593645 RepID=UPI0006F8129B|nr:MULTISPECIES: hypothetical protein [unclassified Chryseobacterium]KQT22168.1 hypothetical protein ASG31_02160 [Chryseobacterium sp. Leaf404]